MTAKLAAETEKYASKVVEETERGAFGIGSQFDVSAKVKQKQGLSYLPWASAWAVFKKLYPDGRVRVLPQEYVEQVGAEGTVFTAERPWHTDGKTGWVEVTVSVGDEALTEWLPILDFKNKSIPASDITSLDANKAYKRCATKAIAMLTGIGLYIYEGEDLPEEVTKVKTLQDECLSFIKQKCKTEELTEKVAETCKSILPEECNGDPKLCEDAETLTKLKKALLAIRVIPKKEGSK